MRTHRVGGMDDHRKLAVEQALMLADGLRVIDSWRQRLETELDDESIFAPGGAACDYFTRGLAAAMAANSLKRQNDHMRKLFGDVWPAELCEESFRGLFDYATRAPHEYLMDLQSAMEAHWSALHGLYERLAEDLALPAYDRSELGIDEDALQAWLADR